MIYSIVGILVIIMDQLVKYGVDKSINYTKPVRTLIPGVLSLVRVENDGAAFSFLAGSGARVWFIILTGIFALLVVLALVTNFVSGKFGRWCLVLVTAGGLANMIDRVRYGFVVDMFRIDLFDFAVFNVADIFITVFAIAFIIYILFGGEKEREEDADEFDDDYDDDYDEPRRVSGKKPSRRRDYDDYDEEDGEDEDYEEPRRQSRKPVAAAAETRTPVRRASAESREYVSDSTPRRQVSAEERTVRPTFSEGTRSARQSSGDYARASRGTYSDAASRTASDNNVRASRPASRTASDAASRTAAPAAGTVSRSAASAAASHSAAVSGASRTERSVRPASSSAAVSAESSRPVRSSRSTASDPFAEWDRVNSGTSSGTYTDFTDEAPARSRTSPAQSAPSRRAAASARPVVSSGDEFNLDDILNEFK